MYREFETVRVHRREHYIPQGMFALYILFVFLIFFILRINGTQNVLIYICTIVNLFRVSIKTIFSLNMITLEIDA